MIKITRRTFLSSSSLFVLGTLAGCPDSPPRQRELVLRHIEVTNRSDGGVRLRVSVENLGTGSPPEWATFTNVSLIGYTAGGEVTCQKDIGTVEPGPASSLLNLKCEQFPVILTFSADQGPCDEDTYIGVATYEHSKETNYSWDIEKQRDCGEGLPPDVSFDQPPANMQTETESTMDETENTTNTNTSR